MASGAKIRTAQEVVDVLHLLVSEIRDVLQGVVGRTANEDLAGSAMQLGALIGRQGVLLERFGLQDETSLQEVVSQFEGVSAVKEANCALVEAREEWRRTLQSLEGHADQMSRPLAAGDRAPSFTCKETLTDAPVSLEAVTHDGPALLIFLRHLG